MPSTFESLWDQVDTEDPKPSKFEDLWNETEQDEKASIAQDVQRFGVEAPQRAIAALESALPVGLATQSRLQRKEDLQRQTEEARYLGKEGAIGEKLIDLAYRTVEPITPSGIMNQPFRLAGRPDVYEAGKPLVQIPRNPAFEGTALGGVANVAFGAIESMTTPEMWVTAPGLAASALARGLMAWDMARSIPEQVAQSAETLGTPESTAQEKVEAIAAPALSALFSGALARGHVARPKEIPLQTGKALEVPEGARVPRIEPPAGIERVSPIEAEQVAQRMQETATAAFDPRHRAWPRPDRAIPTKTGPLPQPTSKLPRATVPEGPLEPEVQLSPEPILKEPKEITTWDDIVTDLKARGTGAETRSQIQAMYPDLKLSMEVAGNLGREAFGEGWKPGGAERAPGPRPIEGLSPEQQAIVDIARTQTMTAEERALAQRMLSGGLEKPSEAQPAPAVERIPSEAREVQREWEEKGREAIAQPTPEIRPGEQPGARIETEAPKAPEPVIEKPIEATMESAQEVLAMSPADFARRAKSFNKVNLELGRKVTDAELAELEQMAAQANERWQQARQRAETERTPEAMNEMMALSSQPQYFNEAIAEARKLRERKPDIAQGEGGLAGSQPPIGQELRDVPEQGKGPIQAEADQSVQETIVPKPETIQLQVETAETKAIAEIKKLTSDLAEAERQYYDLESTPTPTKRKELLGKIDRIKERLAEIKKEAKTEKPPVIQGMGGAVPFEFERTKGPPMSMRVEEINRSRIARGEQPMLKPETVHDQDVLNRAMAEFDKNPAYGEQLIDRINTQGGALSDVETHALLIERINVWEERNKAAARARQAYEDSKQFPNRLADMAAENAQTQFWADRLDAIERASRASAREKGLALRAQRIMLNQDFTLDAMEQRALQARGFRELPPEQAAKEKAELTKLADEYKAKSDALQKRIDEIEADAAVEAAKQKATEEPAYHPRVLEMAENYAKRWDERGKQALTDLKALFGGGGEGKLFSGVPIGPEVLDKLAIYGISKMVRGAVDFAKWTDAMVKDIGEGFRQHAKTVWDEANARLDKDLAASESKFGRDAKAVKSAVKTGATAPVTPETIVAKMSARRLKDPRANISTLARKLARLYIEKGVTKREQLLDRVHEDLRKVEPSLTRRGTMDILSGYGDYSRLPKDEVSKVLRDLQGQMQQIAKLEDMAAGKAPARTGRERRVPSDIERRLSQQVEEAKRKGGYEVTDPERQLRTALDAVKKRLENQISDLETQIQTKTKIVREKTPIQEDAATVELRRRRDELKAQYDEIFAKPELTDSERLAAWKERTQDRIEEAREILAGTRQKKVRRDPIELDREALRLKFDLKQITDRIREREVAIAWEQRTKFQKVIGNVGEAVNTSRSLLISFDLSAPGRQGLILSLTHPIVAARAARAMFTAVRSEREAFRLQEELKARDNAPLYEASGLELTDQNAPLTKQEENFRGSWAQKIPVAGRFVKISERGYVAYLNRLSADVFDTMSKGLTRDGVGNMEELKAIANYINVARGRGSVGVGKMAGALNGTFFAPRYVASRFQYLAGQPLYRGTARTRRLILKEYGKMFAATAAMYAFANAMGLEVGVNPFSKDFGKIKVGDTTIDPMGGLIQTTVFAAQNANILASQLGLAKRQKINGRPLQMGRVWESFLRGKLAPMPGLFYSVGVGKFPGGKKVTPGTVAESFIPITGQDLMDAMRANGVPAGAALTVLAFFGMGLYSKDQK